MIVISYVTRLRTELSPEIIIITFVRVFSIVYLLSEEAEAYKSADRAADCKASEVAVPNPVDVEVRTVAGVAAEIVAKAAAVAVAVEPAAAVAAVDRSYSGIDGDAIDPMVVAAVADVIAATNST